MNKILTALLLLIPPSPAEGQYVEGNRTTNQMLNRGPTIYPAPQYYGSPPFPLFRCDGQRPPMFGGSCPNWDLQRQQMKVLKLQEQELIRRSGEARGRGEKKSQQWKDKVQCVGCARNYGD